MRKTTLLLMIIAILLKFLGLARDISLSYYYGASNISDAYLIALTIPMVIFGFVGVSINTNFIPMYNQIEKKFGVKESNKYTNNLINILLLIFTIVIIFVIIFTNQIVNLFASGFDNRTLAIAVNFTRISIFGIYFTGIVAVLKGFLQIKENYYAPVLIGLFLNFIILFSIITSYYTNIIILVIGYVVATAFQLIVLIPFIYRKGYRYRFILEIKNKSVIKMAHISLPVIFGTSVNHVNVLVDRTLASNISVGGISALSYSNRINGFVQGIVVSSIVTVLFPIISKMAAKNNISKLKRRLTEAINLIIILVIPATVGSMFFSKPIIHLIFGRGAFDIEAISMTSNSLFFYSIGMIGFGLREVLSRAFYSLQDTKTPMINASIALVMNIILNFVFSRYIGIGGLALATSISTIVCTILLFISLNKKIGSLDNQIISILFLKILFSSAIMGLVTKLYFNYLTSILNQNLSLIFAIIFAAILYFTIIYFMNIDDVDVLINAVKRKFRES